MSRWMFFKWYKSTSWEKLEEDSFFSILQNFECDLYCQLFSLFTLNFNVLEPGTEMGHMKKINHVFYEYLQNSKIIFCIVPWLYLACNINWIRRINYFWYFCTEWRMKKKKLWEEDLHSSSPLLLNRYTTICVCMMEKRLEKNLRRGEKIERWRKKEDNGWRQEKGDDMLKEEAGQK